jgi:endonuclease/exonuclease/phosphatase family metal-dependent hydrolase
MPPTDPLNRAASLSALTLNLRFGRAPDGPHRWEKRRPALRGLLRAHRADFMAFQEAMDFQVAWLRARLPDYGCIGLRQPAPAFWQNNVIFHHQRWVLRRTDHFFLSPTPDLPSRSRRSRWPRQATIGLFEGPPGRLVCVTTHLDFSEAAQLEATEVLLKRLERFPAGLPTLLLGDFNCTPASACYLRMTAPPGVAEALGPALRNAFKPPFPGTFHGYKGGVGGRHIDWLLFRGGLCAMEARVLRGRYDGGYPSDHYPLWARFHWTDSLAPPCPAAGLP